MRCWIWHKWKWEKPFEVLMEGRTFVMDYPIGEPRRYGETRQRAVCERCGIVKERVITPGIITK